MGLKQNKENYESGKNETRDLPFCTLLKVKTTETFLVSSSENS
jgi:hypothetical protein